MINEIEKTFFNAGNLVIVKHPLPNKPVMLVQDKVQKQYKKGGEISNEFVGIKCIWFDSNQCLQEAIFNTKDLEHYNNN